MFISFFLELRAAKVPASLREFLTLLEAMRAGVAGFDIDQFYFLSRAALVKDERHLDRFDRVFAHCFNGIETPADPQTTLPDEWLKKLAERYLTEAAAGDPARVEVKRLLAEVEIGAAPASTPQLHPPAAAVALTSAPIVHPIASRRPIVSA